MMEEKKGLSLEKIVDIKRVGVEQTFDFTVPNTKCFFANNILVHNTGALEEHSDSVVLLDWLYKTVKGAEMEDYKIHVAKNRNGRTGFVEAKFKPHYYHFEEKNEMDKANDKEKKEKPKGEAWSG